MIANINRKLLNEYTHILMGEQTKYSKDFFIKKLGSTANDTYALEVFRYAFEIFLGWSPEEAGNRICPEVIKMMKLDMVMNYLKLPPEVLKEEDYKYIVYRLYPQINYDIENLTIKVFKDVLSGKRERFSKNYFVGRDGKKRAYICLLWLINKPEFPEIFYSSEDIYKYFSIPSKGEKFLNSNKLQNVMKKEFGDPVSYIHEALDSSEKNEFYYHYYKFQYFRAKTKISPYVDLSVAQC